MAEIVLNELKDGKMKMSFPAFIIHYSRTPKPHYSMWTAKINYSCRNEC